MKIARLEASVRALALWLLHRPPGPCLRCLMRPMSNPSLRMAERRSEDHAPAFERPT